MLNTNNHNQALIPLDTPSQEVNNISNLKSNSNNKRLTGFTLLEILLVIGIISILAGITIIAINPSKQLAQVRNTERKSDIKQIYNALNQYYIDNGHYPNTLLTSLTEICDTDNATSTHSIDCTNLVDLSSLVPTYLTAIPTDPKTTSTNTDYMIMKNNQNKITLYASEAELNSFISMGNNPIPTDGLISYWSFDGNANDSVGTNHGTLYGDTHLTTGVKGIANTAYAFDGDGDYINAGDISANFNNELSVSGWINPNIADDNIRRAVFTPDLYFYIRNNGYIGCKIESVQILSTIVYNLNQWAHVLCQVNSLGETFLYINGLLISQGNIVFSKTNGTSCIGSFCSILPSTMFIGSIDNIRIYNKALTADEIKNIYEVEKP